MRRRVMNRRRVIESVLAQQLRFQCTATGVLQLLLCSTNCGPGLELILHLANEGLEVGIGLVGLCAKAVADPETSHALGTQRCGQAIVLVHLEKRKERKGYRLIFVLVFKGFYNWNFGEFSFKIKFKRGHLKQ